MYYVDYGMVDNKSLLSIVSEQEGADDVEFFIEMDLEDICGILACG